MDIQLSLHARQVMERRNVSVAAVFEVLRNYRTRYPSASYRGGSFPGTYVYQGEELAVVVNHSRAPARVVTVLLRSAEQWSDDDVRAVAERSGTGVVNG